MKEITTVGVHLAKSVFTVHGVDAARRIAKRSAQDGSLVALGNCVAALQAQ